MKKQHSNSKGMTMHNLDYTRTEGSGHSTNKGKRKPASGLGGMQNNGSARTTSGGNKRK